MGKKKEKIHFIEAKKEKEVQEAEEEQERALQE